MPIKGDRIRAMLPAQAKLPSDPETTRKFLEEFDREERPYRTKWRCEILDTGISLPKVNVVPWIREHLLSLDEEIQRCWFDTGLAYTYGLFQSATLMTCIVVELTIERYLLAKDLWSGYEANYDENRRTFGALINYCKGSEQGGGYLTPTIIEECSKLNKIRIEAAHMNNRRNVTLKIPPQTDPANDMDEIENVTVKEDGEKAAYMAINDMGFLIDPQSNDIYKVRAFKHYARQAIALASTVTKMLFALY